MHFIKRRKVIHWIAALAILLGALAPAVSQALSLAGTGQGFAVEVCTTSGTKMTQVIGEEQSSSSPPMGSHCPYCVVQPIYFLPGIGVFEFAAPQSYATQLLSAYQAPQILSAWVMIPSRAPPANF